MSDQAQRTVLVVEDEEALAVGLRDALLHGVRSHRRRRRCPGSRGGPDPAAGLLVLDLMLPGMSGLEVLKALRAEGFRTRVLIVTALADEEDLLRGFQAGADDYLTKPFSHVVLARVEAQFRRVEMDAAPPEMLQAPGGIGWTSRDSEVHRDGQVLPLTPRGDILKYLIRHRDRVVTRDDLLLDVWHYQSANVETRTVDIHIVGLRRKVEPDPAQPSLIQTVRGKGYRWHESA